MGKGEELLNPAGPLLPASSPAFCEPPGPPSPLPLTWGPAVPHRTTRWQATPPTVSLSALGVLSPALMGKAHCLYYSSSMASCLPACRGGVSKGVPEDASGGSLDFELAPARCPAAAWISHLLHNCLEGRELLREARKGPGFHQPRVQVLFTSHRRSLISHLPEGCYREVGSIPGLCQMTAHETR